MAEIILDIGGKKKQYKLSNGNFVELDPGDLNLAKRAKKVLGEMEQLEKLATDYKDNPTIDNAIEGLEKAHKEMCEKLNYIFDSDVSTACCGNACMFDMQDGLFRYERIISGLLAAYEQNIQDETKAMRNRMKKAKAKYSNV